MRRRKPSQHSHTALAEKRMRLWGTLGMALVLCVAFAGSIYLRVVWTFYQQTDVDRAVNLGNTVGALIHSNTLPTHGPSQPITLDPRFHEEKSSLMRLVKANPGMAYAFIVVRDQMGFHFLMDSEPASTAPHMDPTGFMQETTLLQDAFQADETIFTEYLSNAQGRWVATMTPLFAGGAITTSAVLGIVYPTASWNSAMFVRILPHTLVVFSLLILSVLLYRLIYEQHVLKHRSQLLSRDEALFHSVFDQAPIGISIGGNDKVTYTSSDGRFSVNHMFEVILGRTRESLETTNWQDITHPDDLQADIDKLQAFRSGDVARYTMEKRYIRPDGSTVWTNLTIGNLIGANDSENMHLCILEDITERKRIEQALQESERSKAVLLSHLPGMAYRCQYDPAWTMEFVSEGCEMLTGYKPENLLGNRDVSYNDLIAPEYRSLLWAEWAQVLQQSRTFRYEYEIITRGGERKWVLELGQFIYGADQSVLALEGIVIDISELKMREAQISYLHKHDFLTGLYNRVHCAAEKQRLAKPAYFPLSLVICDINGVRLVNDAFGPAEGDRLIVAVSRILQSLIRENDVCSRTGGDEFMLLLPHTTEAEAIALIDQVTRAVDQYNRGESHPPYEVSLSFGYHTMVDETLTINQATITAEEHLSHRKLLNQRSSHNAIVSSIMATLYARSQETEEHGKRLTQYTQMIGEQLNLDRHLLDELELLSMLHDIGKVGVADRILNKPAPLTHDEWDLMKKHPEIGYRIALSTPELEHIARYILSHHEKWDGSGYPAGLAGEEIPLASRILAIADAYDAMTEDRVYRKAMDRQDALAELARCAGTQFDPSITQIMIRLLNLQSSTPA